MAKARGLEQFLCSQGVNPQLISWFQTSQNMRSTADFAAFFTRDECGLQSRGGFRDRDIVGQIEPFKSNVSNPQARIQIARLRAAWEAAQKIDLDEGKEAAKFPSIKFTYFNVEGGGECVRLAFALGGVPYVDDRVDMPTQWKDMKPKSKFTQLPVLTVDGGEQIAQSGGHLRYAAMLGGLYPQDPVEMLKVEEVFGLSWDMVNAITPSMQLDRRPQLYGCEAQPQEELTQIAVGMRQKLSMKGGEIDRFLGYLDGLIAKNGTGWFVGNGPTMAECEIVPRIRSLRKGNRDGFPPDIVDKHVNLMKMYFAFHELPAIKAHYKGVPPY